MATIFLLVIALGCVGVIWDRHAGLADALQKHSLCLQKELDLAKTCAKLEDLEALRKENKNLVRLEGQCLVYRQNVNNTAVSAEKHVDDLWDLLKTRDGQAMDQGKQKEECQKDLSMCRDDKRQIEAKLQEVDLDKQRLSEQSKRLSNELTECQQKIPS